METTSVAAPHRSTITFRAYRPADYDETAALWTRVNRELSPPHMRALFEEYITVALNGELKQLQDIFAEAKRNAFWVVEAGGTIVGTFGIEMRSDDCTELRRMYLDRSFRGGGIAQQMLCTAETRARELGFARMILSTAEVQKAAIAFYRKQGYQLIKTEVADTMSIKTVGGGLSRLHFEKAL